MVEVVFLREVGILLVKRMNNQSFLMNNSVSSRKPLVTIIIPAYNSSDFILDAVNSIVIPGTCDAEVIIIDDGSTDDTMNVINCHFSVSEMIKVIAVPNGGVSRARNIGIQNARGEFICFLDSDDQLEPNFLSILIQNARENKVDVQLCGYYKHYINNIDKQPKSCYESQLLLRYLSGDVSFHIGSMLIKKSFIDRNNIKFNEDLFLGEDILFICQLLALAECKMSLDYLYHHNYRKDSLTTSKWNDDDYLHDIYAMQIIKEEINKIYKGKDRIEVFNKLTESIINRKIRYLWKLFLSKKYNSLKELCDAGFLDSQEYTQAKKLPIKYRKRVIIFKLNNITLWKMIRLFNFKKAKVL